MTGRPQLGPRLRAVDVALTRALTGIAAHPDRQAALQAAEQLRAVLTRGVEDAAAERAQAARDIWTTGRLTLLELAQDHLGGVTEQRAGQIVNAARDRSPAPPRRSRRTMKGSGS